MRFVNKDNARPAWLTLLLLLAACSDGPLALDDAGIARDADIFCTDCDARVDTDGPLLRSIAPNRQSGGVAFKLTAEGDRFAPDATLLIDDTAIATTVLSPRRLSAQVGPLTRGEREVTVRSNGKLSAALKLHIDNTAPQIKPIPAQTLDEDKTLDLRIEVEDSDQDPIRVYVDGLPPGAQWSEATTTLSFRPDFIQGGRRWRVEVEATDGVASATTSFTITVNDTIHPPDPTITRQVDNGDHTFFELSQTTDGYLDSPGYAGRSFVAYLSVPKATSAQNKRPVRIKLHGFNSKYPEGVGGGSEFQIAPHDMMDTYWWGYSDQLPDGMPTKGTVPNYTQRRVLHLLEWVLQRYPGADRERVWLRGGSMGGTGVKTLGLLYARHFCYVDSHIGQTIPRNHRPLRISQLSTLWGAPEADLTDDRGMKVWDRMDLTRAMAESAEARDQFVYAKHGKDDSIIHFGAVVQKSPLTKLSFYEALATWRVGHFIVWDEGGHGSSDPVMGDIWWEWGWDRINHEQTFLRRDLAFVAFSGGSADQDPGDGRGNGKQAWRDNEGYAGQLSVPGDTGWSGQIAGARNRFLRWNSTEIVDSRARFAVPIKVLDDRGLAAPRAGYPTRGNRYDSTLPLTVDVTPRRVKRFRCMPGERIAWSFGAKQGTAVADDQGTVTIRALPVTSAWTTLSLTRAPQGS